MSKRNKLKKILNIACEVILSLIMIISLFLFFTTNELVDKIHYGVIVIIIIIFMYSDDLFSDGNNLSTS